MNVFYIALKDLQVLLKEQGSLIYLFVLPMVFILVLSSTLGAVMGGGEDNLITLPVVNLDPGGESAQELINYLNRAGGVQVKLYPQSQAQAQLGAFNIGWLLTIPKDFGADLEAGRPLTLKLLTHPEASETAAQSVLQVIDGVVQELALEKQLIASFEQMGDMMVKAPDEYQVFTPERAITQAQSQMKRAETQPLIVVDQSKPVNIGAQVKQPNAVQQNVPGYTIIFVFVTAGGTAYSIYKEKKEGSFRRLLAAPMSKATLLAGKMLPNFITALIQIVVIFAVSVFLLPMMGLERLTLGQDPLALVLVSLMVALCSTGMGILIAALARTEGQIGGLSTLLLWTMGAVGGCLFPPFLLGGILDTIGKIVPHYWAIQAYQDLIVRGRGLADVTTELLALAIFSVIFMAIGLWRFEFD